MRYVRSAVSFALLSALTGCATTDASHADPIAPKPSVTSDALSTGSTKPSIQSPDSVTQTRTRTATAPTRTIWKSASASPTQVTPSTHKTSNPVTATSTPDLHTPTVALVDSDVFQAGTYGSVQVSVVIVDGIITDISMLQQPDSNSHTRDLARIVFPNLISNVIESQSNALTISGVSGASYDFVAFKQALQSVLNKANL